MHTFEDIVTDVVNQSGLLFRNVSTQGRRKAINDRIEQVRGMVELAHRIEYPILALSLERHMEVLKQTLKQN